MNRSLLVVLGSLCFLLAVVSADDKETPKKDADKNGSDKLDADKTPPGPLPIDKLLAKNKELVPTLIGRLTDPDAQVRQTSAYILANIGKEGVLGLIVALGDKDAEMRANAAYVLGALGKAAQDAMPALVVALKDENSDVRQRAAYAIQRILSESPPPVPPPSPLPPMPPATDEPKKTEPKKDIPKDKPGAAARPVVIPASYSVPRMDLPSDPGLVLPLQSGLLKPALVPDFLTPPTVPQSYRY